MGSPSRAVLVAMFSRPDADLPGGLGQPGREIMPTPRTFRHPCRNRRLAMDNTRYEIILYWSEQDQAIIAEVPELPGCAADGATYQEAITNVERVIQEWIETARE